ncbi:uncharacterized protein MYCFIDRAFT_211112 [Pseudocercospora fijiensis CIRAD86]|uniref:nitric oxide dioxygenase n=1 Tax=Pseudocercospora fijiensis (strain CIRAD86) TaxID=383855 RepID=M3ADL5_PSEFD|nr:uncharacterized protein MYCFIDRAFT_211112 [Pseudocercospora fijiensis CIRAD86]EME82636.1 hypothetical protein MYCFIDRAFT_211112 [Pseudocercospora fijiensis CIRAD86]
MRPLTPEQVKIIKAFVPILKEHGDTVTSLFYKTLHEEYPFLHNVFNQTNQANNHQAKALAASLYAYASHIDDLGALSPAVEKICHKHASLYIRPEHYKLVGEGLIRAMGSILGETFTPEIKDAWEAAYWQLANILIGRENQLYQASQGWTDWRDFTISDKVRESEEITSLYLKPVDGETLPEYLPGQYISLLSHVPTLGYTQSRQYTLSSAPRTNQYRISVKREAGLTPGCISNLLHSDTNIGDIIKLSHPAGDFFYDPQNDTEAPLVLLSAGVGITPMVSILNSVVERGSKQPISFIHGARNSSVRGFASQIRNFAVENENVQVTFFLKSLEEGDVVGWDYTHVGRLTVPELVRTRKRDLWLEDERTMYFVCGPEGFMADVARELKGLGVDNSRIRLEVFGTGEIPTEVEANGVAH